MPAGTYNFLLYNVFSYTTLFHSTFLFKNKLSTAICNWIEQSFICVPVLAMTPKSAALTKSSSLSCVYRITFAVTVDVDVISSALLSSHV